MRLYETEMTVGRAASAAKSIAQQEPPEAEEIPEPDGDGWQLVSIVPVLFNEPYLQYFWQRQIDDESEDVDSDLPMSPNPDITLSGQ